MAQTTSRPGWAQVDSQLGGSIRDLRLARGMTLVEVAEAAGLSHPFLSQVERGQARPSMRSLFQIAEALGTTQQALMASVGGKVVAQGTDFTGGARLLTPAPPRTAVTEFVGGPTAFADWYRHTHAELLYVVAGAVEVQVRDGDQQVTTAMLQPRGSIGFAGDIDHRWRQLGQTVCVVVSVAGTEGGDRG